MLANKSSLFQIFEGTTSIKISQKSVFLIAAELAQTAPKVFGISHQIKTKAGKLIT